MSPDTVVTSSARRRVRRVRRMIGASLSLRRSRRPPRCAGYRDEVIAAAPSV